MSTFTKSSKLPSKCRRPASWRCYDAVGIIQKATQLLELFFRMHHNGSPSIYLHWQIWKNEDSDW